MGYHIPVDVFLFDLDGTIVLTTGAAEAVWKRMCATYNVDPEELFKHSHGVKTSEILARFFPDVDNTDNKAVIELEVSIVRDYENCVEVVPGAKEILMSLDQLREKCNEPARRWAIVTSGSAQLAFSWFNNILKPLTKPEVFITAFDVKKGKPDPEGYARAKVEVSKQLNWNPSEKRAVVFEDAPAGLKAGKAMGAITVGITSTYPKDVLFAAGADYVVPDLSGVKVTQNTDSNCDWILSIENALNPSS